MQYPTVALCGPGRAGKDEAGKFLGKNTCLTYIGSLSWVALPYMAKILGICEQEAWETRHDRRVEWYEALNEYRKDDPTRLVRDSLARGTIVVGVRDRLEIVESRREGLLTHILWIDRPGIPRDPTITYGPGDCDQVILNDGTLPEFHGQLLAWCAQHNIPLKSS